MRTNDSPNIAANSFAPLRWMARLFANRASVIMKCTRLSPRDHAFNPTPPASPQLAAGRRRIADLGATRATRARVGGTARSRGPLDPRITALRREARPD